MKVRKKRSRVEGVRAYVPFQAIEILVIDASDITPAFPRPDHRMPSGAAHMTLSTRFRLIRTRISHARAHWAPKWQHGRKEKLGQAMQNKLYIWIIRLVCTLPYFYSTVQIPYR